MGKFLLYLAIAFILWRIVTSLSRKGSAPTTQVRGAPPREERVEPRRGPEIDYSRVRDAEYREIETRRIDRDRDERSTNDRSTNERAQSDRATGAPSPDAPRDPDGRADPDAG